MTTSHAPAAPAWRPEPSADRWLPGGGKVFVVGAGVLVLCGAVAAWLCFPRPYRRPYFLALAIDQHRDERLPANPWAGRDSDALLRLDWSGRGNGFTSQTRA